MKNQGQLGGRRILVTGAASGIGLATCQLFVQEGATVCMLDRNAAGLEAARQQLGEQVHARAADVADEAQLRAAVATLADAAGGLDGIVNAAGISRRIPFESMTSADWAQILAVNLTGAFNVCSAALPFLRRAPAGTIVNLASGVALRPIPDCTAYAASKGGLIAFGKALAVELAPHGIRVNTICPGIVETPMIRASITKSADPQAEERRLFERRLLKRFGQPAELAHAALFLTSHNCAYATGSVFAIDGGGTMH